MTNRRVLKEEVECGCAAVEWPSGQLNGYAVEKRFCGRS